MMRSSLLLSSFVLAGMGMAVLSGSLANAQPPSMPQGTPMGQPPGTNPRATNPMDRPNYSPGMPSEQPVQRKMDDKKFVQDTLLEGMTEVELSKLAAQKSANEEVKQFAQKMTDDRAKADEELKILATKKSIKFPDTIDSKHQSQIDKMAKLSGTDLDKAYLKGQVKDHQQDLREFQMEAQSGSDPDIKTFAAKTLPGIQDRLNQVKNLDKGKKATAMK